jgi:hypothetical protein
VSNGCAGTVSGSLYFASFFLLINLIFLNLFIGIILEAFQDSDNSSLKVINQNHQDYFRDVWAKFDPDVNSFY